MTALPLADITELAFRAVEALGQNDWMVLVTEATLLDTAVRFRAAVVAVGEEAVTPASTVSTHEDLEAACRGAPRGLLVLTATLTPQEWEKADANRSRLQRSGTTVLVLDEQSFGQMEHVAPNLSSWLGGQARHLRPTQPTPMEVDQRLQTFREWSGKRDDEVVALALSGKLPADPSYAEWLTLLGRGDLLVR